MTVATDVQVDLAPICSGQNQIGLPTRVFQAGSMDQVSFSATQFTALASPYVNMVGPGEGITVWALGILLTIKAMANETGGSYSLFEDIVPPGIGPPIHVHTQEDETWYMLEGELTWKVGSREFHATKGCFIHLPRFVPHGFINNSDKPAHMVVTYAPGGFEKWFLDIGKPVSDRYAPGEAPPLTPELVEKAHALGKEYGLIFTGPNVSKEEPLVKQGTSVETHGSE